MTIAGGVPPAFPWSLRVSTLGHKGAAEIRRSIRARPILAPPMRNLLNRIISGGNDSNLNKLRPDVERINELESHYENQLS